MLSKAFIIEVLDQVVNTLNGAGKRAKELSQPVLRPKQANNTFRWEQLRASGDERAEVIEVHNLNMIE